LFFLSNEKKAIILYYKVGGGKMAKFFSIMIILLFMINIRIGAYSIIAEKGLLNDEYLLLEDTEVIDGTVDWNKRGEYTVSYRDLNTENIFNRKITIIDSDELTAGYCLSSTVYDYKVKNCYFYDALFKSKDEFFVYGAIKRDYFPYNPIYTEDFFYVAYYQKGCLIWENIMYPDRYGCFTDACLVPEGVALIGDYDAYDGSRNIVICVYNYNGDIVYRREIRGEGNDFGHRIFYDEGILRFVGVTNSQEDDYSFRSGSDYDILCGNYQMSAHKLQMAAFGNNGTDIFYDAVIKNHELCISMEFVGSGFFKNNDINKFGGLLIVDKELNVRCYAASATNLKKARMYVYNDYLVFAVFSSNQSCLYFYYYNSNLQQTNLRQYSLPPSTSILDFKMLYNKNIVFYATGNIEGRQCIFLSVLDDYYREIIGKVFYYEEGKYIFNVYQTEHGEIYMIDMNDDKTLLSLRRYIEIRMDKYESDYKKLIIYGHNIYVNGQSLFDQSIVENTVEGISFPYGHYINTVSNRSDSFSVYLPFKLYYPPQFNVKNHETYDIDYYLFFNGDGYLNNEPINIGYRIAEPGNYILEIIGNNGEKSAMVFSVDYLSETENDMSLAPVPLHLNAFFRTGKSNPALSPVINLIEQPEEKKQNLSEVYIAFTVGLMGLLTGLIFPFDRWRKKNA